MSQKIVSQLDTQGYFYGPVIAYESPLEPGIYLIPGGAVDVPAPTVKPDKRYRFTSGKWVEENIPIEDSEPNSAIE